MKVQAADKLAAATKEAKWITKLCGATEYHLKEVINIWEDNKSAIAVARNPVHHQLAKHIDCHYHFIRDEISKGNVTVNHISSADNHADIFTRELPRDVYYDHLDSLTISQ